MKLLSPPTMESQKATAQTIGKLYSQPSPDTTTTVFIFALTSPLSAITRHTPQVKAYHNAFLESTITQILSMPKTLSAKKTKDITPSVPK